MAKVALKLESARAALSDANRQIGVIEAQRAKAILDEDDTAARKFDGELENMQRNARIATERVRLLEQEAVREEAARRDRDHEGQIKGVEREFVERDKDVAELQATLALAVKQFRRVIERSEKIAAAWPWSAGDQMALLLSGKLVATAVSHELFHVGTIPFLGGRPGEKVHPSFPGAACPDHRLRGLPEQIPSLASVFAQTSQHGGRIMRGSSAVAPASANGEGSGPVRSDQQQRLAALLKEQARLSEDFTPEGEAAYKQVVAEIAAIS